MVGCRCRVRCRPRSQAEPAPTGGCRGGRRCVGPVRGQGHSYKKRICGCGPGRAPVQPCRQMSDRRRLPRRQALRCLSFRPRGRFAGAGGAWRTLRAAAPSLSLLPPGEGGPQGRMRETAPSPSPHLGARFGLCWCWPSAGPVRGQDRSYKSAFGGCGPGRDPVQPCRQISDRSRLPRRRRCDVVPFSSWRRFAGAGDAWRTLRAVAPSLSLLPPGEGGPQGRMREARRIASAVLRA